MSSSPRISLDALPEAYRRQAEAQLGQASETLSKAHSEAKKGASMPGTSSKPAQKMNKTETRYSLILDYKASKGEILSYDFEAVNLRLGANLHYRPDFMVIKPDGLIEFHEVKGGYIREDAAVKIKAAAARFPCFRFLLCKYEKGDWAINEIPSR